MIKLLGKDKAIIKDENIPEEDLRKLYRIVDTVFSIGFDRTLRDVDESE